MPCYETSEAFSLWVFEICRNQETWPTTYNYMADTWHYGLERASFEYLF